MINTPSNIINKGYVFQAEDWVYYSNWSDNARLYKIRSDGTEKQKLSDRVGCSDINVIGSWVYFCGEDLNLGIVSDIHRVRTDGAKQQILNEMRGVSAYLNFVDNWIYYCDFSEKNVYKMRTNGKDNQNINIGYSCENLVIVDNYLYFSTIIGGIYKHDISEYLVETIVDDKTRKITIYEGWIYYSNEDDNGYLYKIRVNGTDRERLNQTRSLSISVMDDWVYYCDFDDNRNIYRFRLDGTCNERLNNDRSSDINIIGDWIYYIVLPENIGVDLYEKGQMYRMHLDGTECEQVN
jgi:hypothetical protein